MLGFLPRLPTPPPTATQVATERAERAERPARARLLAPPAPLSVDEIASAEQFEAISGAASDIVTNGRVAKFLIDRRNPSDLVVRFVNGSYTVNGRTPDAARFHFSFAQAVLDIPEALDEFNAVTYFTQDKRYVAGVLHTYLLDGATEPIYGLQFYPQDVIREELVLEAVTAVRDRITIPGARFAFVATGSQQTTATVADRLAAAGFDELPLDRILGSIRYLPLNLGEAWGVLRVFPADNEDLRPTDIPVFDELPLDLSVVAGVITRAVQDASSHVNLKSKERNTPNMVLRDAARDHPRLAPFADQPVHLVVRGDDFVLEPTTEEVVAAKLAERTSGPRQRLSWEPETAVRSYEELAEGTSGEALAASRRYGAKAANLGFLTHRSVLGRARDGGSPSAKLGYDLVPRGFAVPLELYRRFVDHPPNRDLRDRLSALIAAETAGTLSPRQRAEQAAGVQTAFLQACFPPEDLAAVRATLDAVLPGVKKVKVRSSANAEDIPNFDGAGLHDSFAANTEKADDPSGTCVIEVDDEADGETSGEVKRKVKPKSLACAIKGVYASLWNKRAIEERSFARIDHTTAAMGLAVVPAYDLEAEVAANAVIITRILNTRDVYGYSLSVQEGNNLVTNPDPGTYSEVTLAAFISDVEPVSLTITRFAKPAPGAPQRTTPVLARDQMLTLVELAKAVERAYCRAKRSYYRGRCAGVTADNTKPSSLDLEVKVLAGGELVIKQVREFGGS